MLCPLNKCRHYGKATRFPRACYYEGPQCWKGYADLTIELIKIRLGLVKNG
jgi:hypothetical protein